MPSFHAKPIGLATVLFALLVPIGCAAPAGSRPASAAPVKHEQAAETLVHEGRQAWKAGDGVRAEQYFALALERGYERARLLPELLEVCLSNSRLRAALNHALPYLRQHPEDLALSYLVATIQLGLGQKDQARRELVALLRQAPQHADAHYLLAVVSVDDSPTQAEQHFRRYLEVAPAGARASEVRRWLSDLQLDHQQGAQVVAVQGMQERP